MVEKKKKRKKKKWSKKKKKMGPSHFKHQNSSGAKKFSDVFHLIMRTNNERIPLQRESQVSVSPPSVPSV